MTAQWAAESRHFALVVSSADLRQNPRVPCKSRDFSLHGTRVFWLWLWWAACPKRESRFCCVHGTRCRFWHCYGFFYLAVALQHVSNIFNITPESAPHAPVVASASRRVPRPPLASERRDAQRPRAPRGHPFPFSYPRVPGHALTKRLRQYPRVPRRESSESCITVLGTII
jgi:hypothetical protein